MKDRLTVAHAVAFALGLAFRGSPLGWVVFLGPIVLLGWLWGRFESLPGLVRWLVCLAVVVVLARVLTRQVRPLLDDDETGPGVPPGDPWATPRDDRR